MSVRVPPANFCFLLLCEEVGGRRNIELARWVSMDILRAKLLKGKGQRVGPSLRKLTLLESATRGHPGHTTGDKDNSAQPDCTTLPFAFLRVKALRNRRSGELGVHAGPRVLSYPNLLNDTYKPGT